MGLGGLALPGHDQMPPGGLRRRIDSVLASRSLRCAAAIGNLAAMGCVGLSLLPKTASDQRDIFAGMADPVGAMMPWLLAPLLMTSAVASALLLMAGQTPPVKPSDQPTNVHADASAGQDLRLDRIGHELRTPLTAIIGFSGMMQRELHGPLGCDRYQSYAEHICESGVTLLHAIETAMTSTSSRQAPPDEAAKAAAINAGSPRA